jgi:restriction system protein
MAGQLGLSEADQEETLPSGASRFRNRLYWAKLYLSQSRLLESASPGTFRITDRELLGRGLERITLSDLDEYPEYREFRAKSKGTTRTENGEARTREPVESDETPLEAIQRSYRELKDAVTRDVLEAVQNAPPAFLESLIVKLLLAMGYGYDPDAGTVLGGVHDGGVDGVITKDRLGLGTIYVQAKRYRDGSVGATAIQQFVGSVQEKGADEGIFVTTSTFTRDAQESARRARVRIALIDGERLSDLMFDLGVGVTTESTLALKRIDSEFFAGS